MEDPKDSSSEDEYIERSDDVSDIIADIDENDNTDQDTFTPDILQDLVIDEDEAEVVDYEQTEAKSNPGTTLQVRRYLFIVFDFPHRIGDHDDLI
jgi:hypothetical protein